jgi:hypothetical protein
VSPKGGKRTYFFCCASDGNSRTSSISDSVRRYLQSDGGFVPKNANQRSTRDTQTRVPMSAFIIMDSDLNVAKN